MSKKATKPAPQEELVYSFLVANEVYEALKTEKTKAVLTWKIFKEQPSQVKVLRAGDDEALVLNVSYMHNVFHGYRPEGYPERNSAYGPMTCLMVSLEASPKP